LWMDEHPIADIFAMLPYELPGYLFYDAEAGAKIMSAGTDMSDAKFLQAFLVQNARQLGAAGKILFPIPERGLASRLYRIKAKTVLIWGEGDKLIPPVYAQAFQRGIAKAEVVMIPQAAHLAPFEKPEEVIGAISRLQ
jgi:pimeloyl-ACP methyl ester carboxylesterase